eukprot:GILJ01010035.1.p1 GENE.GILJ01010035.1~~GILJ01010035.1.p1  ORF type:complete len:840 (-),score=150.67 GILJ01010035.1:293-2812(-)
MSSTSGRLSLRLPFRKQTAINTDQLEAVRQATNMDAKELDTLWQRFSKLAPNGKMGPQQFRECLGVLGVQADSVLADRLFEVFDDDDDGSISFMEFVSHLNVMTRGTEDEKLDQAFKLADIHGTGFISFDEFRLLIHSFKSVVQSFTGDSGSDIEEESLRRLFAQLDANRDGFVSKEEYKQGMQNQEIMKQWLAVINNPKPDEMIRVNMSTMRRLRRQLHECLEVANFLSTKLVPKDTLMLQATYSNGSTGLGNGIGNGSGPNSFLNHPLTPARKTSGSSGSDVRSPSLLPLNRLSSSLKYPAYGNNGDSSKLTREEELALRESGKQIGVELQTLYGEDHLSVGSLERGKVVDETLTLERHPSWVRDELTSSDDEVDGRETLMHTANSGRVGSNMNMQNLIRKLKRVSDAVDRVTNTKKNSKIFNESGEPTTPPQMNRMTSSTTPRGDRRSRTASNVPHPPRRRTTTENPLTRKGLAVYFGHENWNLVVNMMVGIRMAVGRVTSEPARVVIDPDFKMKEKLTLVPRGLEDPSHGRIVRFIDYAPMIFRRLRETFGIDADSYLSSIGPEQLLANLMLGNLSSLSELCSTGKSGSFFYFSADGNYMLKTVSREESKFFRTILPDYYAHMLKYPDTLMTRFLGLHVLRPSKKDNFKVHKLHFVVMANVFNTDLEIHRRFDLKGSWVGRFTAPDAPSRNDPTVALKDLDLNNTKVVLGEGRRNRILEQIEIDCAFFESHSIIDYSLLLGFHHVSDSETVHREGSHVDGDVKIPFYQLDDGGMLSTNQEYVYFFGIIDILTYYSAKKRMEHAAKSLRYDRHGISCVNPSEYAKRFIDFMAKIIV